MLNILHISASYKPAYIYGGPTISVSNLCEELSKLGHNVTVFTTTANGGSDFSFQNSEEIENCGVHVKYFRRLTGDHSHFSPRLLFHLWRNIKKYDVVHIHAWWNLVSVGAAFVCLLRKKKFTLSPRGTLSAYSFKNRTSVAKYLFHLLIGKKCLRSASFLVSSVNEKSDVLSLKVVLDDSIEIVANILELPDMSNIRKSSLSGELRIIFLSRIEQKKGLEYLIDSLNLIEFAVVLNIYGAGDDSYVGQLKKRVINNKKSNKIFFHGPVYGREKYDVIASHDILVLPSYNENFANVILECLNAGTPVALTPDVGLSDFVYENNLGWRIERDARQIASVLSSVNEKRLPTNEFMQQSKMLIHKIFNPVDLAQKHIKYYQKIK